MAWVYILHCGDDSLYVGLTEDLPARVQAHAEGRGCSYTARRLPVSLVHSEEHRCAIAARTREQQLKRWTRAKKEALIAGDIKGLRALSKRTDPRQQQTKVPPRGHFPAGRLGKGA